jgi:hypothetical protein
VFTAGYGRFRPEHLLGQQADEEMPRVNAQCRMPKRNGPPYHFFGILDSALGIQVALFQRLLERAARWLARKIAV